MPKQTFFNLPNEKQQVLMNAAKKEFSRVSLNKSSIANIVKDACIPRGSFYQYFENKEDAFYYLLEKQTKEHNKEFMNILESSNGDIFEAFTGTFRYMIREFQEEENRSFFKNAFLHMDYKMERKLAKGFKFNQGTFDEQYPELLQYINKSSLHVNNDHELIHVMQILMAVTLQNIMHNFAHKYTLEESLAKYTLEIDLLKRGLLKKECSS